MGIVYSLLQKEMVSIMEQESGSVRVAPPERQGKARQSFSQ